MGWFTKNWKTRLTETITFIRNAHVPNFKGDKGEIVDELTHWNANESMTRRQTLSGLMSQAGTPNRPSNATDRKYRRALILLKCAITDTDDTHWANAAAEVNRQTGSFQNLLQWALEAAWDAFCSRPDVAQRKITELKTDPETFLNAYTMAVSGKKTSGRTTYGFYMDAGIYKLDCLNYPPGSHTVDAINVHVTPYVDVKTSPSTISATSSGLDTECTLMLTTQFTGCTYCFMLNSTRSELLAAHIDPGAASGGEGRLSSPEDGKVMSKKLREEGGFSNGNGGTFKAYGRVESSAKFGYGAGRVIIMGVKKNSAWEVYSQIQGIDRSLTVSRIDNKSYGEDGFLI
ncbi:MAG: hypothetical protein JW821_01215 [Deltaproteobacteria bacterium]|nr:hypothetical protein [Deltaproteobacteria bacterium]